MLSDPYMAVGFGELKIFSGSAHPELAREIAAFSRRVARAGAAASGFRIRKSRSRSTRTSAAPIFSCVQPTCASGTASVDQHIMELMIMIDAFRRSSAARITAVIPYYGYARQDRKDKPRVPISAKLVANVLSAAGANRVLTMDLHKAQIQAFFDIPVDHLFAAPVIIDYLSRMEYPNLTMVAPDAGGAERARAYAKRLNARTGRHRQAAHRRWHGRSDERGRRRRRAGRASSRTTSSTRRGRSRRRRRRSRPTARSGFSRAPCTACCRARRSSGSRSRRSTR